MIHYDNERVTLHHGDCLDVLRELPDASVHAVVTDPPYNLSFMSKSWDAHDGHDDAGFGYWLAGLVDGEGHFAIKQHGRGTYAPSFAVKLRDDDRAVLVHARRITGVGQLQDQPGRDGSRPQVSWVVGDKAGCQRLVDLFDKYPLRSKKAADYQLWREAVCEWTDRPRGNRWDGAADQTRMASLRVRLMEGRAYAEIPWSGHEFQDWCRLWAAECLRVLTPGGHLLAFGGTRTWHRLACAIEDAGFEVRDSIAWLYGSGFPKSLDVGKAIDKAAGATRQVIGDRLLPDGRSVRSVRGTGNHEGWDRPWKANEDAREANLTVTAPATPDAARWQGWGTALKPAHEPIVVARKPLTGTVSATVLAHGTGALNIDGTRVGTGGQLRWEQPRDMGYHGGSDAGTVAATESTVGRWPANVLFDGTQADALDEESGVSVSTGGSGERSGQLGYHGGGNGNVGGSAGGFGDTGGASRFFPVFRWQAKAPTDERPRAAGVAHPTVKPLDLMRWLVRLVTPPGGTVLEPFAGSGTTVEACLLEGFRCVAIEREATYLPLIVERIHRQLDPVAYHQGEAADDPDHDPGLFGLLGDDAA